jgi:Zn-dependent peptidase ImmA (M78 family)
MATTTNPESVLHRLRALMPRRPLSQREAYRLAELQANHLLEAAVVDEPGTPDELVSGLSFLEIQVRDLPVSGLTNWYKPRWLILLNKQEPAVRRRFSLMHEFKHILDHGLAERCYPDTPWQTHDERAERVADYFAASLLMPKRIVKRRFFEGLQDPADLAAEFGVSPIAMRRRLEALRLIDPMPRCTYSHQPLDSLPPTPPGYFRRHRLLKVGA